MKSKKDTRPKADKTVSAPGTSRIVGEISNEADLKSFLQHIRERMAEDQASAIYVVSEMNQILTDPDIFVFLNDENKEMARDIWLRIKQSGFQLRNPPLLFGQPQDSGNGVPGASDL